LSGGFETELNELRAELKCIRPQIPSISPEIRAEFSEYECTDFDRSAE
jgi:hypothetical protein